MFEFLGQFDQLLTCMCGVFVGALGCWLVQKSQSRRQRTATTRELSASQGSATPAIQAAALATASNWTEPERILIELQQLFEQLGTESLASNKAQATIQGRQAVRLLLEWIVREKKSSRTAQQYNTAQQDDTDATLKQRAAEDDLVLQWISDNPTGTKTLRCEALPELARPELAHPELALSQIASELLPFNPIAVRLIGKTADSDMTATVERIEKLLASVDPPESMGTLPLGTMGAPAEDVPSIRDPQARYNSQPEEQQRRRSDQAIIYDTLLRRCLGDDDFAWRMLHKFPTRCRAELESLATELRRRAWAAATRRITQLRGMAANIAADNLRDALANLENVCRKQSATRADQLFEGVYGEFQQVLDFLARAGGEQPMAESAAEENQPISRWPAGLLAAKDHAQSNLEPHSAGRIS